MLKVFSLLIVLTAAKFAATGGFSCKMTCSSCIDFCVLPFLLCHRHFQRAQIQRILFAMLIVFVFLMTKMKHSATAKLIMVMVDSEYRITQFFLTKM